MSWDGFLPPSNCKQCNNPLNADGGRPAELYAGTYTGLCYACERGHAYPVGALLKDGAQWYSHPPHCPAWRRDRETYVKYADCQNPLCELGHVYVSRSFSQGGPYYVQCEDCSQRYYGHPLRAWASKRTTRLYRAAQNTWKKLLGYRRSKTGKLLKPKTEPPQELIDSTRKATLAKFEAIRDRWDILSSSRLAGLRKDNQ